MRHQGIPESDIDLLVSALVKLVDGVDESVKQKTYSKHPKLTPRLQAPARDCIALNAAAQAL